MTILIFIAIAFIMIFVYAYRKNSGQNVYKFIVGKTGFLYNKYAPYSFKIIREKVKEVGQEVTTNQ